VGGTNIPTPTSFILSEAKDLLFNFEGARLQPCHNLAMRYAALAAEGKAPMQRRDFVKAMMAASVAAKAMLGQQAEAQQAAATSSIESAAAAQAALPKVAPAPVPWMHGLMEAKPLPMTPLVPDVVAQTNANFFTDRQFAALQRFSEIMVPPYHGYPGAIEAGAPKFLDFLIGVSPPERQRMYQSGLDRLNAEATEKFSVAFSEANAEQADQLIRPWLRTWMSDNPPTEPYANFINVAHRDIREATQNSQGWSDAQQAKGQQPREDLYWYPVDPDLHRDSCAPLPRPTPTRQPA
jgi:Gluconate 2-dehydrogenase subunit 3